jgi:hypothetical protein
MPSPLQRLGLVPERVDHPSATGATARLCSGSQPRRRSLYSPQVPGVEESMLPEPLRVEDRATQGQGAFETQETGHPRLHQTAGIRGLDVRADISRARHGQCRAIHVCRGTVFFRTTPSRAPARNRSRQCAMGFCARRGCEGAVAGGGVERRAPSSGARGRGPAAGSGLGPSG